MLHTDNELINQIIRTAHDPDPLRAARYRPFAYWTARSALADVRAATRQPFVFANVRSWPRAVLAMARGFALFQRPAPTPCCLAAI